MEQNITYAFGSFRLDTDTQLLWHEETKVAITPKVYRLLLYFLLHSGHLISHEELFDTVWEGRIVDDSALRLAVNSLRKVLHDESRSPHYISTVCKRGYRFLAAVTVKGHAQYNGDFIPFRQGSPERNRRVQDERNWCFICPNCLMHVTERQYRTAVASETSPLYYRPQAVASPASHEHTRELAALQEAFQQTLYGERHLVFLRGEQGMGKTTLLDAFLAKVQHHGLAVLRTRCVRMGAVAEPFLPLLEALGHHCREPYGRFLIERLHHLAPTWLYQMLNVLDSDECAMLQPKVAHINTGRMLREGADFFESLGINSTFILILDNSHWSDEFTLDLLNFLMFRRSAAKLLIIVSYRPCGDGFGTRRIEEMRAELCYRGLCQELSMQKRRG